MLAFEKMSKEKLKNLYEELTSKYEQYKSQNLNLDMSRGKPSPEQLDLSSPMLDCLTKDDYKSDNGTDCRNYGSLDGIPEMKKIFSDILEIDPDEVIVGGNSSLSMMFDNVAVNMTHGVRDGDPWQSQGRVKFICPVPGYDRHFAICNYFHIKMITVPMLETGPDMDEVEKLINADPMIKGIWCTPVFSNPDGCIYSDETVRRIANLSPSADDFRIYWDNAYCIHNFLGERPKIPNILRECEKAGRPNMPYIFTSFSKVSFSGAAVSVIASSRSNCEYIKQRLTVQTIGPDKLNQLRHVRFFKDAEGVYAHMHKMAAILKPKFEIVLNSLAANLSGKNIAAWNNPTGGYFVSLDTMDGCAKRTVAICKEAGVILTEAGATYPKGKDPRDHNIRIAPSYPSLHELETAIDILCLAVQMAAVEKLLRD